MEKVQHLTYGGSSEDRRVDSIDKRTIEFFKYLEINNSITSINLKKTKLDIHIKTNEYGAEFDITKNGIIAIKNFCCFKSEQSEDMIIALQNYLYDSPIYKGYSNLQKPKLDHWLYSVMVNPLGLSFREIMTAGEIELYIYYALYRGQGLKPGKSFNFSAN